MLNFEPVIDHRGYFVRKFCRDSFAEKGLCTEFELDSSSMNTLKHTLRGMHFQSEPHAETKLVSCSKGVIYDVIVDVRPESTSHGKWFGIELKESETTALYIPPGCAHGFITLSDNTQVDYKLKGKYSPQHARGIRFDDPDISIKWPAEPAEMSATDKKLPFFRELNLDSLIKS